MKMAQWRNGGEMKNSKRKCERRKEKRHRRNSNNHHRNGINVKGGSSASGS
jgi:hypothetical protein